MSENIIEFTDNDDIFVSPCCDQSKGLIINPGALGDCILTLPLAEFMQKVLGIPTIDFAAQPRYIDVFPARTCISRTRPIESIDFYRFFVDHDEFELKEKDPLPHSFAGYDWIVSFLGDKDSHFEKNLIMTVYSTHSADISMLPLFQDESSNYHISEFYIRKFIEENRLDIPEFRFPLTAQLINPLRADIESASHLLEKAKISPNDKIILIQPGSGGTHKCWHLDNYCRLASKFKADGYIPLFLLGPAETERFTKDQIEKLHTIGKSFSSVNIKQALQLITASTAYIGNDSGTTHLAAAAGIKTAAIFGPTDSQVYRPIGPKVSIIRPQKQSFDEYCEKSVSQVKQAVSDLIND